MLKVVWTDDAAETDGMKPLSMANDPAETSEAEGALEPPNDKLVAAQDMGRTPGADWYLWIDGEPVRSDAGTLLAVPCEVRVAPGAHQVTLAQPGFDDLTERVSISEDRSLAFERPEMLPAGNSSLDGPWFDLSPGEVRPLAGVNTSGREFDPWMSADGRILVFAGDRAEGRGIYIATRPTRSHDFDAPEIIDVTRSGELATSPVLSPDGLSLVYVHPARTRIWLLERTSTAEPFVNRKSLRNVDKPGSEWPSAQWLEAVATSRSASPGASGPNRLYWLERTEGKDQSYGADTEATVASKARAQLIELPGDHPLLSTTGDRQFAIEGTMLQRYRRDQSSPDLAMLRFGGAEPVASLPATFPPLARGDRGIFVTDDEQWLLATVTTARDDAGVGDQPGDLVALRLADGPQWGWALTGRSLVTPSTESEPTAIPVTVAGETTSASAATVAMTPGNEVSPVPEKEPMVAVSADPSPNTSMPATEVSAPAAVIPPQSLFEQYRETYAAFQKALSQRDLQEARKILDMCESSAAGDKFRSLTALDRAWLAKIEEFRAFLETGLDRLEVGTPVRLGTTKLEFVDFKEGTLILKSRIKTIEKPLWEVSTGDLVAMAELLEGANTQKVALQILAFVKTDPALPARVVDLWTGRSGPEGKEFLQTFASHSLEQGKLALAENRLPEAIGSFDAAIALVPDGQAATAAQAEKARLFDRTKWRVVGKRDWERGPDGEWGADAKRIDGAYLVSEGDYENFVCEFEWKAEKPGAQGGLYFHYAGEGNPFDFGYKIHLAGDADQQGLDQYSTGALFGSDAPKKKVAKKNTWNKFRLTVVGPDTKVEINDEVVLETDVPVSKAQPRGYLAIDGVGGSFRYRKILVYELKTPPTKPQE